MFLKGLFVHESLELVLIGESLITLLCFYDFVIVFCFVTLSAANRFELSETTLTKKNCRSAKIW